MTNGEIISYLANTMSYTYHKLTPWEKRYVRHLVLECHMTVRDSIHHVLFSGCVRPKRLFYAYDLAENRIVAFERARDRDNAYSRKWRRLGRDAVRTMELQLAALDVNREVELCFFPSVRLYELYHHMFF